MSCPQPTPAYLESAFDRPRGVAEAFQTVTEMSRSIAARAAEFRAMASRLGELVATIDR